MLVAAQSSAGAVFTGLSGLGAWQALNRNLDKRLELFAKEPAIAREIANFKAKIGTVQTADQLVGDQRLYEFALTAYELEGQEGAHGLMKRVLSEDLSDSKAAANRMVDQRYRAMAKDFGFAGGSSDDGKINKMVTSYLRSVYEQRTGTKLPEVTTPLQDTALATLANEPTIAAEISDFRTAITKLSTTEEVVADKQLVQFLTVAAGFRSSTSLGDDLVTKLIDDPAQAKLMSDKRWETFSGFFDHVRKGEVLKGSRVEKQVQSVVDRWLKATFALETGREVNEDSSEALLTRFEAFTQRADVASKVSTFTRRAEGMSEPLDLLADFSSYAFVVRAFGVEDFARNADLIERVLSEPSDSRTSPAAYDTRLKGLAEGMAFLGKSNMPATGDAEFVDGLVEKYVRVQFERAIGASDSNMRYALYAQRALPKMTSAFQILGDLPIRQFVLPAIGLPATTQQDIDKLAGIVEKRLEVGRLGEADYMKKLTQRFFATATTTSMSTGTSSSGILTLLGIGGGTSGTSGIGLDLLLQTQARN